MLFVTRSTNPKPMWILSLGKENNSLIICQIHHNHGSETVSLLQNHTCRVRLSVLDLCHGDLGTLKTSTYVQRKIYFAKLHHNMILQPQLPLFLVASATMRIRLRHVAHKEKWHYKKTIDYILIYGNSEKITTPGQLVLGLGTKKNSNKKRKVNMYMNKRLKDFWKGKIYGNITDPIFNDKIII